MFSGLWERRKILITKQKKLQQVAELTERFSKSKAVVLTEYKGLTVREISELRRLLKESKAEYKVIKNTLVNIAAKGTLFESAKESFTGPTGIAFGFDNPIEVAKKVLEYSDKNNKLKIKSGVIEGKFYCLDEIKAISKLPPKNVLLGMIAGAMQAPTSKLASALNATLAQFAYAMEALKTRKQSATSSQ